MKINTNSNVYIITYSVVMVVLVAVLLTLAAVGLKPLQDKNILEDNKSQIVKALGSKSVTKPYLLDKNGVKIDSAEVKVFATLKNLKASHSAGKYPIFVAEDGSVVVPLYGKGLWDAIWGFIALEPDMNTVKGIVLNHKGETPGLGAEIATPKHQAKYVGKKIFDDEQFVGITLVKGGAENGNLHQVDAITGGTKTSDGVTKMIKNSLAPYEAYFKANKVEPAPVEETTVAEPTVAETTVAETTVEPAPVEETTVEGASDQVPSEGATETGESSAPASDLQNNHDLNK